MGTYGTPSNPAHYVEIADPANPGQVKRPDAGQVLKARTFPGGVALADITTSDYGYWSATFDADAITVSGDDGATWVGPLFSSESMVTASAAGTNAALALTQSATALSTAEAALAGTQTGSAGATWDVNIVNQPTTFPASPHSHTATQISDASTVGKAVLTAADGQAARAAIGAGTGNGTSNLALGNTATTAAPGNHQHAASSITFTPAGGVTATDVQSAIMQAATMGGSGGSTSGSILEVFYASGAYPTQAATAPAGIKHRAFYGPTQYVGPTWAGVVDTFQYVALT